MTSQDYIDANIAAWEELAHRANLIGKQVIYVNRDTNTTQKGRIRRIRVEDGRFIIESDSFDEGFEAPQLNFKIDEERDPHGSGDTIWCNLDDDYRQIRILLSDPVAKPV